LTYCRNCQGEDYNVGESNPKQGVPAQTQKLDSSSTIFSNEPEQNKKKECVRGATQKQPDEGKQLVSRNQLTEP